MRTEHVSHPFFSEFCRNEHGIFYITGGAQLKDRELSPPPLIRDEHRAVLQKPVFIELEDASIEETYEAFSAFGIEIDGPTWMQEKVTLNARYVLLETILENFAKDRGLVPVSTLHRIMLVRPGDANNRASEFSSRAFYVWRVPELTLVRRVEFPFKNPSLLTAYFADGNRLLVIRQGNNWKMAWEIPEGKRLVPDHPSREEHEPFENPDRTITQAPFADGIRMAEGTSFGLRIIDAGSQQVLTTLGDPEPEQTVGRAGNPFDGGPRVYPGRVPIISADQKVLAFAGREYVQVDGDRGVVRNDWLVYKYRHPEYWWGVAWLPEFWFAALLALFLMGSIWRDRHLRRR
ncbi:MAG TPA: hypothetical protein VEJ63_00805 [Planctomycetota bacterium]|nr:hypothetical protein [Planctomycetota bacterium]